MLRAVVVWAALLSGGVVLIFALIGLIVHPSVLVAILTIIWQVVYIIIAQTIIHCAWSLWGRVKRWLRNRLIRHTTPKPVRRLYVRFVRFRLRLLDTMHQKISARWTWLSRRERMAVVVGSSVIGLVAVVMIGSFLANLFHARLFGYRLDVLWFYRMPFAVRVFAKKWVLQIGAITLKTIRGKYTSAVISHAETFLRRMIPDRFEQGFDDWRNRTITQLDRKIIEQKRTIEEKVKGSFFQEMGGYFRWVRHEVMT